jgi:hypothetical protein
MRFRALMWHFICSCNFLGPNSIIYGYIQVREVVVRQNMCGVPAWTWFRHTSVIPSLFRKLKHNFSVCTRRYVSRSISCTVFFGAYVHRRSTRHIPYTRFSCGCARRWSTRLLTYNCFFHGCVCRCPPHRRAWSKFFRGCAGTFGRAPSSQRLLLPLFVYYESMKRKLI